MRGEAFCPAHVTGFFKAGAGGGPGPESAGSLGAGFSIRDGVTTTVRVERGGGGGGGGGSTHRISINGAGAGDARVSDFVAGRFLQAHGPGGCFVDVGHEIPVPVGCGLGCSGAAALSLAYALDQALQTGLPREEIGRIAHVAEVSCGTGLGDVLASYHGGFEIRTGPGAPGIGRLERIDSSGISAVIVCFAPVSTAGLLRHGLPGINGLGGRMVDRLRETRDRDHFQDMSLEFAERAGVVTPRMRAVADDLRSNGARCGVALFGETVFSLVPDGEAGGVLDAVSKYGRGGGGGGAAVMASKIDQRGAGPAA